MKNICKKTIVIIIILLLIGVSVSSAYSKIKSKDLKDNNHPPNPPRIIGEIDGIVGVKYEYSFYADDPDGDDIEKYVIDWCDGSSEETVIGPFKSGEPVYAKHAWSVTNVYKIGGKAKDIYGKEGDWGYLKIFIPRRHEEDCNCKEIDSRHLAVLERQLNRLEVYTKLLLVLSKYNPELMEISEELSNRISTLRETNDDRIICNILKAIAPIMILIVGGFVHYIQEFEDNPIIRNILIVVSAPFFSLYLSMVIYGVIFCGLEPFPPEI